MEINTLANGTMAESMVKESIFLQTVTGIPAFGETELCMALEQ
jgi:hypothetical protein